MKAFTYAALLTGFGAITLAGTLGSSVPAAAKCMVDEGNGRYVPCQEVFTPQKNTTKLEANQRGLWLEKKNQEPN
jgi:hypothetical protein